MKVTYDSNTKGLKAEFDCATQQELFKELSEFQEVFEDVPTRKDSNGNLMSPKDLRFNIRKNGDDEYFEVRYVGDNKEFWGVRKAFGCHKKGGGLFPQRKDKDGEYLPHKGWVKWDKESEKYV
jgi:hypothetical protein